MRLFIAEKPDLAKAIAEGLGGGSQKKGFIECGSDIVTWCFGHMLQLSDPDDYNPEHKNWKFEHLPTINIPWKYKSNQKSKDQLKVIIELIKKSSAIVNAGDPDEEGQLLVD
jgi:DNA topoisomerase-3